MLSESGLQLALMHCFDMLVTAITSLDCVVHSDFRFAVVTPAVVTHIMLLSTSLLLV